MTAEGKRRFARFDRAWTVEVTAAGWREVIQLSTQNVSRGGMFVCAEDPLPPGTRIEVMLVLPDETVFQAEGVVAHALLPDRAGQLGKTPGFGVHFDERFVSELALLELVATNELGAESSPGFSEDYLVLPAVLRGQDEQPESVSLYRGPPATVSDEPVVAAQDAGEDAFGEFDAAPDTERADAQETESPAAGLVPPPVDPEVLDEVPAPPPADAELARSGVYERPDLSAELGQSAETTDDTPAVHPPPTEDSPALSEPPAAAATESAAEAAPAAAASSAAGLVPDIVDRPADRDLPASPAAVVPPPAITVPPPPPVARRRPVATGAQQIFGIDFGTSYSSIAVVRGERVLLLEDGDHGTLTPSVVCFPDEGEAITGWPAREKALIHPTTTFRSPKRLIGRGYRDKRVAPFLGSSPLRTKEGPNGQIVADVYGDSMAIPQVCSHIFGRLVQIGREAGFSVEEVLLSAPVGFDKERGAIKRAAELAGLHVVGVIDEPVAAAMAYGLVRAGDGLVAVYDFGGGTFDFTVLEIKGGKSTVIGAAGDDWLGGDDFDGAIAEQAANMFWRKHNVDLRKRAVEWERLLMYCERAKRKLSTDKEFELCVKGIVLSVRGGIDLKMRLDREIFADLCGGLVEQSLEVASSCLELLDLKPTDIGQLVLTGGVTRIPLVRLRVQEFFKQKARMAVNPEHAIVLGNAIYGQLISLRRQKQQRN